LSDPGSEPTAAQARSRHPKKHRLSKKGRHATKQAQALATALHKGLSAPNAAGHVNVTNIAREMHATLGNMRHELSKSRKPKEKAAARGLADLQTTIAKLAEANTHADPAESSRLLYSAIKAYEDAQKNVKEAGDAWPL
jgi:hypothetical protein